MHTLTSKKMKKFARTFGFEHSESELFERYIAATYLSKYVAKDVELIERTVLGGGEDQGVDIAAVLINSKLVFEPEEIDEVIADQDINTAKIIFIQAKTSESFDSKLIAKFLHGVESITKYSMDSEGIKLHPQLADIGILIDRIAENMAKFSDTRIPCELYYVTTSSHDGTDAAKELQVTAAIERLHDFGIYNSDLRVKTQGHEHIAAKEKERLGPQNVKFTFEKRQTIPAVDGVDEAYIGLLPASEVLKLLTDGSEARPSIFEDNVRLDLGDKNPVNQQIYATLSSQERTLFPLLNNGLTVIASKLQGTGDRFLISGYQIVNGGQTSHQLLRWAKSEQVIAEPHLPKEVLVPIKIVSSGNINIRSRVAIATNLQSAIGNIDIQSSSPSAKDVEAFFEESGADGLRYERQHRGDPLDFPRTRVVDTSTLNRAVASTIFGESALSIASPKNLETEDSIAWGDYHVEIYYYAAWIVYRVDRFLARSADYGTLKAAKYHIAMMVSGIVLPELIELFSQESNKENYRVLKKPTRFKFEGNHGLSSKIEEAIPHAAEMIADHFKDTLDQGRSLRKDDVRATRHQEQLLKSLQKYIHSK